MAEACLTGWRDHATRRRCINHLSAVNRLLEHRLPHLRGRTGRIEAAVKILGTALHLSAADMYALALAARFHDIGLLGIPDAVLLKPGTFTPAERACVDKHAALGGRLVAKVFPDFPEMVEGIWFHHERPDGRGPYGLEGDEVGLIANTIALAEAVESMANQRPHRAALGLDEITAEIERNLGTQFHARLVAAWRRVAHKVYQVVAPPAPAEEHPARQAGAEAARAADAARAAQAPAGAGDLPPRPDTAAPRREAASRAAPSQPARSLRDLSPLIEQPQLQRLVREGLELRAFSLAVDAVIAATSNPYCTTEDVVRAVMQDPVLSVRILKLANSSAYRRGRPADNLKTAIGRIGTREIRDLAMALGVLERYQESLSRHVDPRLFWEHSIATGLIARALSRAAAPADRAGGGQPDYYLWGMLHDFGRLVLLDRIPEAYGAVLEAAAELRAPLELVEARMLLLNHCQILETALEHWHFPPELVVPVASHHRSLPELMRLGRRQQRGAATIALADRLARALALGSSANAVIHPLDELLELLELPPETVDRLAQEIPAETASLRCSLIARARHAESWPDLAGSLKQRLAAPLRPLCVSGRPAADAYRIFLQRLADPPGGSGPNLGVLYLRQARQQEALRREYENRERQAADRPLPLLVICDQRQPDAAHAWLKGRRHVLLRTPVHLESLLAALSELLG